MGRKMWAHWVHPSFKRGQAILELALFGSILIMLLGLLISYGMKYNFQQQVMQQAFRKALASAAESVQDDKPNSVSHIVIKDHHIPNPANPFAVGSVAQVSASASVTRNHHMQKTAEKYEELPQISLDINGQIPSFKTVAFRAERDVRHAKLYGGYDSDEDGITDDDEKDISRYAYVYGSKDTTWWEDPAGKTGACACPLDEVCTTDDDGVETCSEICPERNECKTYNIIIMDNCAGEIMDYDKMQNRCYQIKQAGIARPWYCGEDYKPLASLFTFAQNYGYSEIPDLGALSDENKPKMGLQGDYTQELSSYDNMDLPSNNTLTKTESASAITTTDTLDWRVDTKRTVVYNEGVYDADDEAAGLGNTGFSKGVADIQEPEIATSVGSGDGDYDWENWNEWETPF